MASARSKTLLRRRRNSVTRPRRKIVKYGPPFSLGRVLRMLTKSGDTKIELTLPGQLTPQLQSGRAYFLPSFYAP